jgi:hypothetical protein
VKYRILLALPVVLVAACDPERNCDEPGVICTIVGNGETGLANEGDAAMDARLYWPSDVTIGPDGNPWVLDWNNHRIITFQPDADGESHLVRITGNALVGDGPFDVPATDAYWNHPTNLVFKPDGTFVFAAWHNSRVIGVDPVANTLDMLAGNGGRAFSGDGGPATEAGFDLPVAVQYDDDGKLYVADQANWRIRCIDVDGTITTVVGNGEQAFGGDGGPALEASLNNERSQNAEPAGRIAIANGMMYIADTSNERIRVVDMTTWTIDTFAGTGEMGTGADGDDALSTGFHAPRDVAVGPDGAVYVADTDNSCVKKIADGEVTVVAGTCGEEGFDGDGHEATTALLDHPLGLDVTADGAVWIADTYNQRIRRITP